MLQIHARPLYANRRCYVPYKLLGTLDNVIGGIILAAVIFGPWAFGTTQEWAIRVMNGAGLTLWGLLLAKQLVHWKWAQALRWGQTQAECWPTVGLHLAGDQPGTAVADSGGEKGASPGASNLTLASSRRFKSLDCHSWVARWFDWAFVLITGLILGFCLISAWNVRATYRPEQWRFDYHPAIEWLPHSYDGASSWKTFWMYLGLAGVFSAVRGWALSEPGGDEQREQRRHAGKHNWLLPPRLSLLLWVLSLNGALLGLEGVVQRVIGSNRLLWMVEPAINKTSVSQFGPYAYRSNAAQYFNLLWPVTLGLWWTYHGSWGTIRSPRSRGLGTRHHLLLSCAILMAVCPLISSSRAGAIIMVLNAGLSGTVLLMAQWRGTLAAKVAILILLGAMVGAGLLLGWQELLPRFETFREGLLGREGLFLAGQRMAADQPVFGTGPGTFSTLYHFFRRSPGDPWPAQLHNDWLEIRITFGWVGSILIGLGLLASWSRWFASGGIYGERHFVMLIWIALGGCLIHARYDFPFQIHSILALFLVLCAVLSSVSRKA